LIALQDNRRPPAFQDIRPLPGGRACSALVVAGLTLLVVSFMVWKPNLW
jgi:hypothetical protein